MSVYFFDVYDGALACLDEEGGEFPDLAAARLSAIDGIRSIVSSAVLEGSFSLDGRLEVRDQTGALALVVPFTDAVRHAPAHQDDRPDLITAEAF